MLVSLVESVRRTTKWYKNCFFHILDRVLLNSHVLYKSVTGKAIPLAKFQMDLIREILNVHHTQSDVQSIDVLVLLSRYGNIYLILALQLLFS